MCRRIFKEQTSETGDIPFYKIGTFGADLMRLFPESFLKNTNFYVNGDDYAAPVTEMERTRR